MDSAHNFEHTAFGVVFELDLDDSYVRVLFFCKRTFALHIVSAISHASFRIPSPPFP